MTRALSPPIAHFSAEPDFVDSCPPHCVRPEESSFRDQSRSRLGTPHLEHARRRDSRKRFLTDCAELPILDFWQLNADPAHVTDVGRPEEAFRIRVNEIRLDAVRGGAPDR